MTVKQQLKNETRSKQSNQIAPASHLSESEKLIFSNFDHLKVEGVFSKIDLTSDGGIPLIRDVENTTGIVTRVARCFTDHRHPKMVVQPLPTLLKQRVVGLLLGYDDQNDHSELCNDKAMALLADIPGIKRKNCEPLGDRTQMFRIEQATSESDSPDTKMFSFNQEAFNQLLLDNCFERIKNNRQQFVMIDFDGTSVETHGQQEGRKYNGHSKCLCLHTLLAFVGNNPIYGIVQPGNVRCAKATAAALDNIVPYFQQKLPNKLPVFRADGEFRTPSLLLQCDRRGVGFVVGYARNKILMRKIKSQIKRVEKLHLASGQTERVFTEFDWTPQNNSWQGRSFRVIAKVEYIANVDKPLNVRFIVTNLDKKYGGARKVYCDLYCGRGDSENQIKENQVHLCGKRMSAHQLHANQMRLNFSIAAQMLANDIRRIAFKGTVLGNATFDTIRKKIFKIAAVIRKSKQRIRLEYSTSSPYKKLFVRACNRLHKEAIRIGKLQARVG